jgi:hypothetical protein
MRYFYGVSPLTRFADRNRSHQGLGSLLVIRLHSEEGGRHGQGAPVANGKEIDPIDLAGRNRQ